MALSLNGIGSLNDNVDRTSYTLTLSRALAAFELGLIVVHNQTGTGATTPTLSGGGVTWVQVASYAYDTAGAGGRISVFRAMGATPSGTSITISFGGTGQLGCQAHAMAITGADRTGADGAGAVRQSKTGTVDGAGTSESITLTSAVRSASSLMLAFFAHQANEGSSPGSGGTELADTFFADPGMALQTQYELGDSTISSSWATAEMKGSAALEVITDLNIAVGGAITPTGSLRKTTSKLFGGTITPTGALATFKAAVIVLAGGITPTGDLFKTTSKSFSGGITPTGSLITTFIRSLLETLAEGTLNLLGLSSDSQDLTATAEDTLTLDPLEEEDA